jgi:type II secretory ATPase GspE/PulE/Tfp pilus assembly ATPase PilB-like protein
VIGRFINMGVEPYNFVSALNCIMAQRLVRVICENCKRKVSYAPRFLKSPDWIPRSGAKFLSTRGPAAWSVPAAAIAADPPSPSCSISPTAFAK